MGLKVTHVSTGVYDVTLTLAKCATVTTAPQVTVNDRGFPAIVPIILGDV